MMIEALTLLYVSVAVYYIMRAIEKATLAIEKASILYEIHTHRKTHAQKKVGFLTALSVATLRRIPQITLDNF